MHNILKSTVIYTTETHVVLPVFALAGLILNGSSHAVAAIKSNEKNTKLEIQCFYIFQDTDNIVGISCHRVLALRP